MSIVVGTGIIIGGGVTIGDDPAPPQPVMILITEAGDILITEASDQLTTE